MRHEKLTIAACTFPNKDTMEDPARIRKARQEKGLQAMSRRVMNMAGIERPAARHHATSVGLLFPPLLPSPA